MDAPASVRGGIAIAASLLLQACSMPPQDMACDTSSPTSIAPAPFVQDNPSVGGIDRAIARLRNDLLQVEELEAGAKMHQAGKLAAQASRLRRSTWQAATNLAQALAKPPFPDLAGIGPPTQAADRRRHIAEVAELLARAGSKYPGGEPTTYMGDAYIPSERDGLDPVRLAAGPVGASRPAAPWAVRSRSPASPAGSGARVGGARDVPGPGSAGSDAGSTAAGPRPEPDREDDVHYSNAVQAPAFAAPPVDRNALAQTNKASFQAIDGIVKGSAAVSVPSSVKSGDTFFVFLRVKPDTLATLLESMKTDFADNETVIGKAGVDLTSTMTASVSGAGFKAVPKGELTQVVSATMPAQPLRG